MGKDGKFLGIFKLKAKVRGGKENKDKKKGSKRRSFLGVSIGRSKSDPSVPDEQSPALPIHRSNTTGPEDTLSPVSQSSKQKSTVQQDRSIQSANERFPEESVVVGSGQREGNESTSKGKTAPPRFIQGALSAKSASNGDDTISPQVNVISYRNIKHRRGARMKELSAAIENAAKKHKEACQNGNSNETSHDIHSGARQTDSQRLRTALGASPKAQRPPDSLTLKEILSTMETPLTESEAWELLARLVEATLKAEGTQYPLTTDNIFITGDQVILGCHIADPGENLDLFLPPEAEEHSGYTATAIVYTLGAIIWQACDYSLNDDEAPDMSDDLEELLTRMTYDDPTKRCSLNEVRLGCEASARSADAKGETCSKLVAEALVLVRINQEVTAGTQ
eukprot:Clim_evm33s146 gene=Clim_evmTU33s146